MVLLECEGVAGTWGRGWDVRVWLKDINEALALNVIKMDLKGSSDFVGFSFCFGAKIKISFKFTIKLVIEH